jgi:hypothetical protein
MSITHCDRISTIIEEPENPIVSVSYIYNPIDLKHTINISGVPENDRERIRDMIVDETDFCFIIDGSDIIMSKGNVLEKIPDYHMMQCILLALGYHSMVRKVYHID